MHSDAAGLSWGHIWMVHCYCNEVLFQWSWKHIWVRCNEIVLELVGTNLYVLMLLFVGGHVFEWVWELAPTMVHWRHNLIWIQFIQIKLQQQLVGWLVLGWFKSADWPAKPTDPEQPNRPIASGLLAAIKPPSNWYFHGLQTIEAIHTSHTWR